MSYEKIRSLAKDGLLTEGEHHKQWFLEEILLLAVGDKDAFDELIEALDAPDGIPP